MYEELGKELTGKQELFARRYALSGNGTQSALKAGCRSKSAHVTASRWLRQAKIVWPIEELREDSFFAFEGLVLDKLIEGINTALQTGLYCREAQRPIRLLQRLGVFYDDRVDAPAKMDLESTVFVFSAFGSKRSET
jgi:terminase small subunit-like protein